MNCTISANRLGHGTRQKTGNPGESSLQCHAHMFYSSTLFYPLFYPSLTKQENILRVLVSTVQGGQVRSPVSQAITSYSTLSKLEKLSLGTMNILSASVHNNDLGQIHEARDDIWRL